ncbi:MAG: hypothetical protein RLZZ496_1580 [Pseudomonadota bacterium]
MKGPSSAFGKADDGISIRTRSGDRVILQHAGSMLYSDPLCFNVEHMVLE